MEKLKQKMHRGLRQPPFNGNTQQPTNIWRRSCRKEVGDKTHGGKSVWEGIVPSFGAMICRMEKLKQKMHRGLRPLPFNGNTQQPPNMRGRRGEKEVGDETWRFKRMG